MNTVLVVTTSLLVILVAALLVSVIAGYYKLRTQIENLEGSFLLAMSEQDQVLADIETTVENIQVAVTAEKEQVAAAVDTLGQLIAHGEAGNGVSLERLRALKSKLEGVTTNIENIFNPEQLTAAEGAGAGTTDGGDAGSTPPVDATPPADVVPPADVPPADVPPVEAPPAEAPVEAPQVEVLPDIIPETPTPAVDAAPPADATVPPDVQAPLPEPPFDAVVPQVEPAVTEPVADPSLAADTSTPALGAIPPAGSAVAEAPGLPVDNTVPAPAPADVSAPAPEVVSEPGLFPEAPAPTEDGGSVS